MYQEALLGILVKLCDDMFDKGTTVSPVVQETLKALLVVFFVLVSSGDFYFVSAIFFLLVLNPKTDIPFWKAMIPVAGALMVANYANQSHFGIFFVYILLIAGMLYIEDKAFPEEVSTKKILFRVILVGIFSCILANGNLFPDHLAHTGEKGITFALFYMTTSVLTLKSV
jgi:hypothetical protein